MEAEELLRRLQKGAAHFNREYAAGRGNPYLRKLVREYERDVMEELDRIFAGMSPAERREIEERFKGAAVGGGL